MAGARRAAATPEWPRTRPDRRRDVKRPAEAYAPALSSLGPATIAQGERNGRLTTIDLLEQSLGEDVGLELARDVHHPSDENYGA